MTNYDYLYNKEYYGKELVEKHQREKNLRWKIIPDAVVLPYSNLTNNLGGGLLDEQQNYIDGSGLHRGLGCGYDISDRKILECEEDVVYLGLWPAIWGHCLTDNIRRLWVLSDEEFMDRYGKLRFVYVPMNNSPLNHNFSEMLKILGIEKVHLEAIDQVRKYRNVILPDECFWRVESGSRLYTKEYVEMIDRIRDYAENHFTQTDVRKIYFTYRKCSSYRSFGEKKIERFFLKMGYKVVSPEEYTFQEQLNMLLNCSELASTVGSVSHNCIFLRDGAKVNLITRAGFIPEYQLALDQVHKLNITYIDSTMSLYVKPEKPWEGPFYFITSLNLQNCFGHYCDRRERGVGFKIYRNLSYDVNRVSVPAEYYRSVWKEYPFVDPVWNGKESRFTRFCRRFKIWKIVALLWNKCF